MIIDKIKKLFILIAIEMKAPNFISSGYKLDNAFDVEGMTN